jgi:UDP-N-acetylglucosamine 2-epimerase (non-hydrolysing)
MQKLKVLSIFGTRPEAIKMAPLIHLLNQSKEVEHQTCTTGQHDQMVSDTLKFFQIRPNFRLNVLKQGQHLSELTASLLRGAHKILHKTRPDWVLVHGDTTTCFAASLAAFNTHTKIGHIEAGLRTHELTAPFPEEANRILTDRIASAHFAPTKANAENLIREGIASRTITVTGNTVIDALRWATDKQPTFSGVVPSELVKKIDSSDSLLVTCHRRENIPNGLNGLCEALRTLSHQNPSLQIIFPVHLNPQIQQIVNNQLRGIRNLHLLPPLAYPDFLLLLHRCQVVLTDSGGIQEEAAALCKPLLILRDRTERIVGNGSMLVGTDPEVIVESVSGMLQMEKVAALAEPVEHVYGDGRASERIRDGLFRLS